MRADLLGETRGEMVAAVRDPDEHEPVDAGLALGDLVGDAGERPADVRLVHQ